MRSSSGRAERSNGADEFYVIDCIDHFRRQESTGTQPLEQSGQNKFASRRDKSRPRQIRD